MSEQNEDQSDPERDYPTSVEDLEDVGDWFAAPDVVLRQLADLADAGGNSNGVYITLFMPNSIISGSITSQQDFMRGSAGALRSAIANSTGDGELPEWADYFTRHMFDAAAQTTDDLIKSEQAAYEQDGTQTSRWTLQRYIHLKDAFVSAPGQPSVPTERIRILLAHVSAWTLGLAKSKDA